MSVIALVTLDLDKFVTTYKIKKRHNSVFIGACLESADIVVPKNENVADLHGEIIQHEENKLKIRCVAENFMVKVNGESIKCETNLNHEDNFTIGSNKFTIRFVDQLKDDNGRFDMEYRMVVERLEKIKHKVMAIYNNQHITKRSTLFGKKKMLGKIPGKESGKEFFSDTIIQVVSGRLISWFPSTEDYSFLQMVLIPDTLNYVYSRTNEISFQEI